MREGLISKDALLSYTCNQISGTISANDIARFPVVDAVQVVRCRECVLRSEYGVCYEHGHGVAGNFFCAKGTREKIETKKKQETGVKEVCSSTGLPCSRCVPGPCDRRNGGTNT